MEEEKYSVIKLNGEEYLRLAKIADEFVRKGKVEENPKIVIVSGGTGSGKTTIRKKDFDDGYVFIDAGAIYLKLTENETKKSDKDAGYCRIIGDMIITTAIEQKKNIVIEIIGDKIEQFDSIIPGMTKKGYKVENFFVAAGPVQAFDRHLKQQMVGGGDISTYFTQDGTIQIFADYFDKKGV